nr:uncharacterized protein LOC129166552 [Nothobranchius furzeri]
MFSRVEEMNSTLGLLKQDDSPRYGNSLGKISFLIEDEMKNNHLYTDMQHSCNPEDGWMSERNAYFIEQLEKSQYELQKSLTNAVKMKNENDRLEAQNIELKRCLEQYKEDMGMMATQFYNMKKTLDESDDFTSQVNYERSQSFLEMYQTNYTVEDTCNKINAITATAKKDLEKNKDRLICNLREHVRSALLQVEMKLAWSVQKPSDTFQFSGNCITALQNAIIDSEQKICQLNEQMKIYTHEIEQKLQFSKDQMAVELKDREVSDLSKQVENLKTELESAKMRAQKAEQDLKHAKVCANETEDLVKGAVIKFKQYNKHISHLQSTFNEFGKWKNQIGVKNGKAKALSGVIDQLEESIKDLAEESETVYDPKLHKPLTDLSQVEERALEMEVDYKELTRKNKEADREIQQLKNKLKDSPSKEEINSYRKQIQELQKSEAALSEEVSGLRKERSKCNEEIASLNEDLAKAEREKISAERNSEELKQINQQLEILVNSLKKKYEANESCKQMLSNKQEENESTARKNVAHTKEKLKEMKQRHDEELAQLKLDTQKETKKYINQVRQLEENLQKELENQASVQIKQDPDIFVKLGETTVELLFCQERLERIQKEKDTLEKECEELKIQVKQLSGENKKSGSRMSPGMKEMEKPEKLTLALKSSPEDLAGKVRILQTMEKDPGSSETDEPCYAGSDDDDMFHENAETRSPVSDNDYQSRSSEDDNDKSSFVSSDSECESETSSSEDWSDGSCSSDSTFKNEKISVARTSPKENRCLPTPDKRGGEGRKMKTPPKKNKQGTGVISPEKTSHKTHSGISENYELLLDGIDPRDVELIRNFHLSSSDNENTSEGEISEASCSLGSKSELGHDHRTSEHKKSELSPWSSNSECESETSSSEDWSDGSCSSDSTFKNEKISVARTSPKENRCLLTPDKRGGEGRKMKTPPKKNKQGTGVISPEKTSHKTHSGISENYELLLDGIDPRDVELIRNFHLSSSDNENTSEGEISEASCSLGSKSELGHDHRTSEHKKSELSPWSSNSECESETSSSEDWSDGSCSSDSTFKNEKISVARTSPKENRCLPTPDKRGGEGRKMKTPPKKNKQGTGVISPEKTSHKTHSGIRENYELLLDGIDPRDVELIRNFHLSSSDNENTSEGEISEASCSLGSKSELGHDHRTSEHQKSELSPWSSNSECESETSSSEDWSDGSCSSDSTFKNEKISVARTSPKENRCLPTPDKRGGEGRKMKTPPKKNKQGTGVISPEKTSHKTHSGIRENYELLLDGIDPRDVELIRNFHLSSSDNENTSEGEISEASCSLGSKSELGHDHRTSEHQKSELSPWSSNSECESETSSSEDWSDGSCSSDSTFKNEKISVARTSPKENRCLPTPDKRGGEGRKMKTPPKKNKQGTGVISPEKTSHKTHSGIRENYELLLDGIDPRDVELIRNFHLSSSDNENTSEGEISEASCSLGSKSELGHDHRTSEHQKSELSPWSSNSECESETSSSEDWSDGSCSSDSTFKNEKISVARTSPKENRCLPTPDKRGGEGRKMKTPPKKNKQGTGVISPEKTSHKTHSGIRENYELLLDGIDPRDVELIRNFHLSSSDNENTSEGEISEASCSLGSKSELGHDHRTSEHKKSELSPWSSNSECESETSSSEDWSDGSCSSDSTFKNEKIFVARTSPKENRCLPTPDKRGGEGRKMKTSPKKKDVILPGKMSLKNQSENFENRKTIQKAVGCSDGVVSREPQSSSSGLQPLPTESARLPVRERPIEQGSLNHKVLPPIAEKSKFPPISSKPTLPSIPRKPTLPSIPRKPTLSSNIKRRMPQF